MFPRKVMQMLLFALLVVILSPGCAVNTEPIERASNRMIDEVVSPAVQKAVTDLGQRSAALQGQGSLINPGYVMDGYGIVGTGFVWTASVKLDGVSANLAGATQADQGPDVASTQLAAEAIKEETE
jgi:hypothetical protein